MKSNTIYFYYPFLGKLLRKYKHSFQMEMWGQMSSTEQLATKIITTNSLSEMELVLRVFIVLIAYDLLKRLVGDYFLNWANLRFNLLTKKNMVFIELRINFFCKLITEVNSIQLSSTFSSSGYSNQLISLKSEGALFLDSYEQKLVQQIHDLMVTNNIAAMPGFIEKTDSIKEKLIKRAKL